MVVADSAEESVFSLSILELGGELTKYSYPFSGC